MNRFISNVLFVLTLSAISFSCQKSIVCSFGSDDFGDCLCISKDSICLSIDDAVVVANSYLSSITTKSTIPSIKSTSVFKTKSGIPAFYSINYNDKCVLVSATKKYSPIIAILDGELSCNSKTYCGIDIIINEYKDIIGALIDDPDAPVLSQEWSVYEKGQVCDIPTTRVEDDYYDILQDYIYDWVSEGYSIRHLNDPPDNMPSYIYDSFCETAELYDLDGYEYMYCSIIAYKNFCTLTQQGPLVQTYWSFDYPYNAGLSPVANLGPVTATLGQIMKYYEYPTSYDWDNMPNSLSVPDTTTCSFLASINSSFASGCVPSVNEANIVNILKATYHFSSATSFDSHNVNTVKFHLANNRPVYESGRDNNTSAVHSWICDGHSSESSGTDYVLFTLEAINEQPVGFTIADGNGTSYSVERYHYNWGRGGSYNGFFTDAAVYANNNHYSSYRKDIYVLLP